MKKFFHNFKTKVIFQIILILVSILAGVISFMAYQNLLVLTVFLAVLIIQVYYLVKFMDLTNRNFRRFLEAINYSDFSQSFSDKNLGRSFSELSRAYSQVVEKFKNARAEKEKSYRYLHTIVQYLNNGLISFDQEGRVDFINRAAKRILDLRYLKTIDSLKSKHPPFYDISKKIRHGEKILQKIQINNDTKQMALSAFEFKVGNKNLKLLSIEDVHNLLEDKELEAWQKLIRVLTHEIMNSLTPISSLSNTTFNLVRELRVTDPGLKEELQDIREALNTIHKRSRGLTDFVKAYRSLTLIPKPEFKIIAVAGLFDRVQKILREKLEQQKINLEIGIDPSTLEISADPSLMEQVLINLLLNSIHALKDTTNPLIKMECLLGENGKVILTISDNGCGIPEQNRGKIFVPFFSTKKSSGIGLSFCKQIMKLHNGQITVNPGGERTTFSLSF